MTKTEVTESSFTDLEYSVYSALETYSNVHRGSGHNSMVTTYLFEQAREIVLEHLGLNKNKFTVIFCTPMRAEILKNLIAPGSFQTISSHNIGLPLGVSAFAAEKKRLPKGVPFQTGGGTASLIAPNWVIWADTPGRFEAGTPAIINIIAFARALQLIRNSGKDTFRNVPAERMTASDILYNDELPEYSGRKLLNEFKQTLIGREILVPTMEGSIPFTNLDNGASTPTFTPVWNAARLVWYQPEQVHSEIIHEVRSVCARVLGAPSETYDVIFTSNTTEAINIAAGNFCKDSEKGIEPVVLNTLLEHSSNELPWRMIPDSTQIRLKVNEEGFVNMHDLETFLQEYNDNHQFGKKRIKLVAISGASNVLGSYNNLEGISRIVHKYRAHLLVDAAQLVAHRKIDMEQSGIDYLAFSAHKLYAPFGSGALVVRKSLLNFGSAELDQIRSSGEENVTGIAAMGKALVLLNRIGLDLIREEEQNLTARTLNGLKRISGLKIFGVTNPESVGFERKGGVIAFSLKNMMPDKLAAELAVRGGIGVRYGCHCAHLLVKHLLKVPSFLEKFQGLLLSLFPGINLPGIVRVSLGIENSEKDVDTLIDTLSRIALSPGNTENRHSGSAETRKPVFSKKEVKQHLKDFIIARAGKVYS
jgi:selenocysteine lyase/cysteine desulfurase